MCGIVGALSLGSAPLITENLKEMCDVIAHRGPDDAGYFVAQTGRQHHKNISHFENFTDEKFNYKSPMLPAIDSRHGRHALDTQPWDLYLGHRRLAILDTSSQGHQPMSDLSKGIWLVYNGEIYNFKELRAELSKLGYAFHTHTDTEVLIAAYLEWGTECVSHFNGMFAFALWDNRCNKLFLARDRYGIKPLYYTLTPTHTLLFASEVKAILKYSEYNVAVDHEALLEYFTFQNIFTDKTLYKDIKLLPAGHYISLDLSHNTPTLTPTQYWDFNFEEPNEKASEAEYVEELQRLFVQAVKRQLVSDVEVGSYLSGGMDSGSITAVAAKTLAESRSFGSVGVSGQREGNIRHTHTHTGSVGAQCIKTFTVGFDLNNVSGLELAFDERAKSEHLSYLYKTEHYEMVLKSGDMERCLPNFSWHLEEPRVGQSYPNYYAAKLASKFVKVVLSGAGGDELFAGYPWRYYRAAVNSDVESYVDKYYQFWQRLIPNSELKKVFAPVWDKVSHVWTRDIFRDVFRGHNDHLRSPEDYINHSLYFEAKTFLHGLLVVEDKLSMAHSLETRVPFLDNDLVDFAQRIPVNFKLGNLKDVIKINENDISSKGQKYFNKTNDGKLILRKALSSHMPDNFINGTKQGFSSPDNSWFKGDSIDYVKTMLAGDAKIYQFLDKSNVNRLLSEHLSGEKNRRLFVWALLNFENWCRNYL